uniref:Ustilago maydis virus P1 (M1) n=1 Tax=Ustilago maydis virus 1 TaxID=46241 RepID=Q90140_9VIRU|nr:putative [Ustilago maydis virus 1]
MKILGLIIHTLIVSMSIVAAVSPGPRSSIVSKVHCTIAGDVQRCQSLQQRFSSASFAGRYFRQTSNVTYEEKNKTEIRQQVRAVNDDMIRWHKANRSKRYAQLGAPKRGVVKRDYAQGSGPVPDGQQGDTYGYTADGNPTNVNENDVHSAATEIDNQIDDYIYGRQTLTPVITANIEDPYLGRVGTLEADFTFDHNFPQSDDPDDLVLLYGEAVRAFIANYNSSNTYQHWVVDIGTYDAQGVFYGHAVTVTFHLQE